MDSSTRVQILDETVCILFSVAYHLSKVIRSTVGDYAWFLKNIT